MYQVNNRYWLTGQLFVWVLNNPLNSAVREGQGYDNQMTVETTHTRYIFFFPLGEWTDKPMCSFSHLIGKSSTTALNGFFLEHEMVLTLNPQTLDLRNVTPPFFSLIFTFYSLVETLVNSGSSHSSLGILFLPWSCIQIERKRADSVLRRWE